MDYKYNRKVSFVVDLEQCPKCRLWYNEKLSGAHTCPETPVEPVDIMKTIDENLNKDEDKKKEEATE